MTRRHTPAPWLHAAVTALLLSGGAQGASADGASARATVQPCGAPAVGEAVRVDAGPSQSGAPITLDWALDWQGCEGARYLVLALPAEARLSGEGFMALGPNEDAPFDIAFGRDRLRAVIPLHLPQGAAGTLQVVPYRIGEFAIDWAAVHVPLDRAGAVGAAQVWHGPGAMAALRPGVPRLVVQDRFDTTTPSEVIVSNSGEYRVDVFDGSFRVFDLETGALLLEEDGLLPEFSPTSRFLQTFHAPPGGVEFVSDADTEQSAPLFPEFTVFDLVAGEAVVSERRGGWAGRGDFVTALHWSPADSFLTVLYEAQGRIGFQPMFANRPYWHDEFGCGACSAQVEGVAMVDAENAFAALGWMGNRTRLDLLRAPDPDAPVFYESEGTAPPPNGLIVAARDASLPGGFDDWPEGLRKLDLLGDPRPSLETGMNARPKGLVRHARLAPGSAAAALAGGLSWRGAGSLLIAQAAEANRDTRLVQRLGDMGIEAMAAPVLSHATLDHVANRDFETRFDDVAAHGPNPYYYFDTGEAARRARLATPEQAEALRTLAMEVMDASEFCIVSPAMSADVWTWRDGDTLRQLLHFDCRVGTGYEPEGALFALTLAPGSAAWEVLATAPFYPSTDDAEIWLDPESHGGRVPVAAQTALHVARLSENLLAISGSDGRLLVVDLRDMGVRHELHGLPAPDRITLVALTRDGRHLVQADAEGRWAVHRLGDGTRVLSGLYIDDEVVAFDAAFNFDATPEAARFVQVRFPGDRRLYTLDQLGARRSAPDLVRRALAGDTLPPPPAEALPPRILSADIGPEGVRLRAVAEAGLAHAALFRDGVEVARVPMTGGDGAALLPLRALPETRWISVRVTDRSGMSSALFALPQSPGGGDGGPAGRLHVLAVGTDTHDDPGIARLDFAAADAANFAGALQDGAARYYRDVRADTLIDSRDLRGDLLPRLAALAATVAPEDTVFLHIAGHGFTDSAGALRLADGATRLDDLEGSALAFDEVAAAVAAIGARVVIFLDACHSGAAGAGTNDDAVAALLASGAPVAVIAASKGRQVSFEAPGFGGGAFTGALVRALHAPEADLDGNGALELSELYARVKREVVQATAGRQTPWIARSAFVGEVPLF